MNPCSLCSHVSTFENEVWNHWKEVSIFTSLVITNSLSNNESSACAARFLCLDCLMSFLESRETVFFLRAWSHMRCSDKKLPQNKRKAAGDFWWGKTPFHIPWSSTPLAHQVMLIGTSLVKSNCGQFETGNASRWRYFHVFSQALRHAGSTILA